MQEPFPSVEQDPTTIQVRAAMAGDADACAWIFSRFSPLLLCQARRRMGPQLRRSCDPEDVVLEVWQRALPKLATGLAGTGRCTPRVIGLLSGILLNRINELLRKLLKDGEGIAPLETSSAGRPPDPALVITDTSVWRRLMLEDDVRRVAAAIEDLDPNDQEIVILRKIENVSPDEAASLLGLSVEAVGARLSRALAKLRGRFPGGIFDELR